MPGQKKNKPKDAKSSENDIMFYIIIAVVVASIIFVTKKYL